MNFVQGMRVIRALVIDTFRQSLVHGVFWILLGVSAICILACLSASIHGASALAGPGESADFLPGSDPQAHDRDKLQASGVQVVSGELSLAFGAVRIPLSRDAAGAVHTLELALAAGVVDTIGILLALIWTSGFLPSFLDAGSVAILLTKPTPRWLMLLGKYLGVLAFVIFQGLVLVGGTWLALGLRTGVWDTAYLASIPLFVLHFAIFFGFSALLAVVTRSTSLSVFGSIAFWCLCWGMNYGRYALAVQISSDTRSTFSTLLGTLAEFGYWILPKPVDLGMLLYDSLGAASEFAQPAALASAIERGMFHPLLSIVASLTFTAVLLYAAVREFELADY
jgi:ABC-type transport system involved in multi-copper enzyme maturation permease subunit